MGTLAFWSNALLAAGFGLQVVLMLLLYKLRRLREMWTFGALILFYAIRAAVLFELLHHVSRESYRELFSGLSWMDLGLQIMLAVELTLVASRTMKRSWLVVLPIFTGMILLALAIAAGTAVVLPTRSPVPADRGTIFTGVLFVELLAWLLSVEVRGWPRSVSMGMAVVGLAGTVTECAKSVTAAHRDSHAFVVWAYGNASMYVAVLAYWSVQCVRIGRSVGARESKG